MPEDSARDNRRRGGCQRLNIKRVPLEFYFPRYHGAENPFYLWGNFPLLIFPGLAIKGVSLILGGLALMALMADEGIADEEIRIRQYEGKKGLNFRHNFAITNGITKDIEVLEICPVLAWSNSKYREV